MEVQSWIRIPIRLKVMRIRNPSFESSLGWHQVVNTPAFREIQQRIGTPYKKCIANEESQQYTKNEYINKNFINSLRLLDIFTLLSIVPVPNYES
jgi:hypothetical protein